MKKDYIVFQTTPEGDRIDLGYAQQFELLSEMDERLRPSKSTELIQFGKLDLEDAEDNFTKVFNTKCGTFGEADYRNDDGTPKLLGVTVADMEAKRIVVKYGRHTGYVYFHNLLCFRNNNLNLVKRLVGGTIGVYFLKREEKDRNLLFSQTCSFAYERKECNVENLEEGQTIECIPTTYIYKYGVFVNFSQGTGLIPSSIIYDWDSLHKTYPIGQSVQLIIKQIDREKKQIVFYPKPKALEGDSAEDHVASSLLEIGKRYQVRIIWLDKDFIKVSYENGVEQIPMDLLPKLFRKNLIKLKYNTENLLIDTVAIEKDGQTVLSVIDAIEQNYNNLSSEDKAYGLKTVEVILCVTKMKEDKPLHLIIARWKGLYGLWSVDDETLKAHGYETVPTCGSFIDLKVVGINPEKQITLRPKDIEKEEYEEIGEEKGRKEEEVVVEVPDIDFADPASIQIDDYPIYVTPDKVLSSDVLLATYEDRNYLVKLNLPDLSFIQPLMKWIQKDSCKLCVKLSEGDSESPYLIWDGFLNDIDIRAIANHDVVEMTVQITSKNYVIFYVGRMIGCVFNEELKAKGFAFPKWGDKIRAKYAGKLINGNQHLLFDFISVCERNEVKSPQLPVVRYNADTDFSILKGFAISCTTQSYKDDHVIFYPPNKDWTFIMDQTEWDETGLPLPQHLGYETVPIYLGIQQILNESGIIKLSRRMLLCDPEYKWFEEEEPDFPLSVIGRKEEEWKSWRAKAVESETQKWLVWRVQNEWVFFRKGDLLLPVKREQMDYAQGTYSTNSLSIGQPVSFLVTIADKELPYQMLSPVGISDEEYASRIPQTGNFAHCQIIKKGETEWKLAGQNWIGTMPIGDIPEECLDIKELKTFPVAVIGYSPATREVICSLRTLQEQIKEGAVLENCTISRKGNDGIFVNANGIEIPVGKMKQGWKQAAYSSLFKTGDAVKVRIRGVNWKKGEIKIMIIGNKNGLLCNPFLKKESTNTVIIRKSIDDLNDQVYIVQFEDGGIGFMDVNESMEDVAFRFRYNVGEKVEVATIGFDEESGLPLLSYNRCHPIQFDSSWFVPNQSYEGVVIRFSDDGIIVRLTASQTRVFIPIKNVYDSLSDYQNHLYKKGSPITVIYQGSRIFYANTIKPVETPPAKGTHCKLTILSVCETGINTWNEEGRLVWISVDDICFKKEIDITAMSYKKDQVLDAYYLKKNPRTPYLAATLKQDRDLSKAYPVGTCLEGRIFQNLLNKKHYIVDLNDVWGDLAKDDISWNQPAPELETNQIVKVRVIRKPLPGNILSVSMLSPDVLGAVGSLLEGTIMEINTDDIYILVNDIITIADMRKTQNQIGIDNFGRIRLHVGDRVQVKLESVNIIYKTIRVTVEKLIQ